MDSHQLAWRVSVFQLYTYVYVYTYILVYNQSNAKTIIPWLRCKFNGELLNFYSSAALLVVYITQKNNKYWGDIDCHSQKFAALLVKSLPSSAHFVLKQETGWSSWTGLVYLSGESPWKGKMFAYLLTANNKWIKKTVHYRSDALICLKVIHTCGNLAFCQGEYSLCKKIELFPKTRKKFPFPG